MDSFKSRAETAISADMHAITPIHNLRNRPFEANTVLTIAIAKHVNHKIFLPLADCVKQNLSRDPPIPVPIRLNVVLAFPAFAPSISFLVLETRSI